MGKLSIFIIEGSLSIPFLIAVEFSKNANSAAIVEFLPFVVFCLATIGVCVFRALTSVGALFYFMKEA